jgi:hypothetical protein
MTNYSVLVGTVGNGLWRSGDGGKTFDPTRGITALDGIVRRLAVDPFDPSRVLAGAGHPDFGCGRAPTPGPRG